MCKRVLNDDENFKHGYPKSTIELLKNKALRDVSTAEHKSLRELVSSGILGQKVLAMNLEIVEKIVINSLDELSRMKQPLHVIDETLRRTNIAFSLFREATKDVNINGSFIFI
ncbi:hypothetical protein V8G54_009549 [Vigna mungo]|uniref:Uncharacterized protein n=1 Tax=Vigna mungo TaxID=3915 RepID=A0AAQ3NXF3_VIGMU